MNSLKNLTTKAERLHMVFMWNSGCDTLTISNYFGIPEHIIYRDLPFYRKEHAHISEVAA